MKKFPEMTQIERLANSARSLCRVQIEDTVRYNGLDFPLYSFSFGKEDPTLPVVIFTGGVHGLERIGTRVVLAYLEHFCELVTWDTMTQKALQEARIIFYPLVNPGGMFWRMRSNPNGVDLMRNAPVDAEELPRIKWLAGQRMSPKFPWYRGHNGLEVESQTLFRLVQREVWPSRRALSLDVHSGYGTVDRLWFPYAKSKKPFPNLAEVIALKRLLDRTYENHIYCVEPQSSQYTAHGDLWDYFYECHRQDAPGSIFIPFSLEMGSWIWVKKNPKQLLSTLGAFNPVMPHRRQRTLRRHLALFDFLFRACLSAHWADLYEEKKSTFEAEGLKMWFKGKSSVG